MVTTWEHAKLEIQKFIKIRIPLLDHAYWKAPYVSSHNQSSLCKIKSWICSAAFVVSAFWGFCKAFIGKRPFPRDSPGLTQCWIQKRKMVGGRGGSLSGKWDNADEGEEKYNWSAKADEEKYQTDQGEMGNSSAHFQVGAATEGNCSKSAWEAKISSKLYCDGVQT